LVVATGTVSGLATDDRPVITVELPEPDIGDTVAMWHRLLPEMNGAGAQLAGLLRVGELGATRAVGDTRTAAALDARALSVEGVVAHVRRRTDVDLPGSVRLTRPHASWDDLVASDAQLRLLHSVVDRVRGQVRVLHDWGLAAATRAPGGTRILLSGPPGTGKTLAAEVTAATLGLDLLVVDLAALVSKWLGETEKNIAEVFDAAERCQAVLFFDEADAVFGKRTDGSDAQARWANLETAYLLGRMERFDGLVILATNLRRNIDDAFVRRLDVVVDLDDPDRVARERLWRRHLSDGAPCAGDVDLGALAGLYEITGGLIRNAVLAAAYAAAAAGRSIDQDGLTRAVHDEYRKAGRSFPGAPPLPVGAVRGGT
jgi:ATP-dependent 26S proteasome regulatory subunit